LDEDLRTCQKLLEIARARFSYPNVDNETNTLQNICYTNFGALGIGETPSLATTYHYFAPETHYKDKISIHVFHCPDVYPLINIK